MFPSKTPLKPNKEFLKLLPICIINSQDQLSHRTLEGKDLQLSFIQKSTDR